MNIIMSGASGFVGSHLTRAFGEKGWNVLSLGREDFRLDETSFHKRFEGSDVVINLAGATIMKKWTEEYKKVVYSSRIDTTTRIVTALERIEKKPRVFISTSAIGIYEPRGVHTEEDRNYSRDFLGRLAQEWEARATGAKNAGIRTVIFRFGIVLGKDGGALQEMLTPFKLGLGGTIGDGKQAFSWVHIDDLVSAYFTAIEQGTYEGVYNLTAPHPSTNEELTRALGRVLNKPTFMRVPAFVLKLQFGEAAEVLLQGQHVIPKRLTESGFTFRFKHIEEALEDLLRG